ncbi:MAG: hypothetical protein LC640_10750, partial [Frankia sp.]|nr:hypothetical protein [Frankia sp.]
MASRHTSRGKRLVALALATGTFAVAATGSAGAAPLAVPDIFGGSAKASSIHIEINLPVAVPGIGTKIEQDISLVDGTTAKAPTTVDALGRAVLGKSSLDLVNSIIGKSVITSLTGKLTASDSIINQTAGPIQLGVGNIHSAVTPEATTSALTSTSTSSLASARISLGSLTAPVANQLNTVTSTLNTAVNSTSGTVKSTVDSALATLNQVSQGATAPVAAQVQAVEQQVTTLLTQLQATIAGLTEDSDLLRLGLLESSYSVTRAADMVKATATSGVADLSVLSGLIKVDAVKSESFSSANGVKGAAAADTKTTVLGVHIGDIANLELTDKGLSGSILGNQLPEAAQGAVKTVLDSVNTLLAQVAGVQILYGQKTTEVDPNGQFARSSSAGVGIMVNPPLLGMPASAPLLLVQLVPAGTAVNAARLSRPAAPPAAPVANPPAAPRTLPHTGANLPLTAAVG